MKKRIGLVLLCFALFGCANNAADNNGERADPLEGFNRTMWKFNYNVLDPYILEPTAKVWRDYIPTPITAGLSNVANNLDEPVSFVNRLIEGNPQQAFVHFNRFWINTVFGLGGLFDLASHSEPLQINNERTFGEALGHYGVGAGPYVVLPVYNATTPRELVGDGVDTAMTMPFWNWVGGPWSLVKMGVQTLDQRVKNLDNTELLRQAQDPYVTFREAYYQNLEFKVNDGKTKDNDKALSDDVLKEID